jgi:hypothetical protein
MMPDIDDESQEADVPQLAVKALTEAHQRALAAGQTLVLVRDGRLIRITNDEVVVLKKLPDRKKVAVRTKTAQS